MCNHFFQQKLRYLLRKCERTDGQTDGRMDKVIAIQPPLYEWGYNFSFNQIRNYKLHLACIHSLTLLYCTVNVIHFCDSFQPFSSGSKSMKLFHRSLISVLYCCWRSIYKMGCVIPLSGSTLPHYCTCPKPEPVVVFFFLFNVLR